MLHKYGLRLFVGGFGLSVILLMILAVITTRQFVAFNAHMQWVSHTKDVLRAFEDVEAGLRDSVLAGREFLTTGRPEARRDFDAGTVHYVQAMNRVRDLTADNEVQQKNIDELSPALAGRIALWREQMEQRGQPGMDLARAMRQVTLGDLHKQLLKLKYAEHDMLSERIGTSIAGAGASERLVIIGSGMVLFMLLIAFVSMWLQFTQRLKVETALQQANAELESRVKQRTEELAFANELLRQEIGDHLVAQRQISELNMSLEARVAERTQQLAAANKELESFSYSVSHDLRTPLRAIAGYSRMLKERMKDRMDDEDLRLIGVIVDSGQKMGNLIDDLLTFSRLGRTPLNKTRIDMTQLVTEVLHDLQQEHDRVQLQVVIEPLPFAAGDRTLLKQVWVNLLSNAIKFSAGQAEPHIEVRGRETDSATEYEVSDNGAGFDMRYVEKLFGVFQRLHQVDEFPGTGVGLAIVHRVIARHGGTVMAEGEIDKGACFRFILPKEKIVERVYAG
ncbi:sensor histidine kinase [Chitinivorax sp. B]|uniref:sensor histidine kinase n=1 Tax=Chitinivorax sp. B TaxID=2502235 RepID=UPI0010F480B8|nr:sensor histidine kinase [Chitinivorax sp. B]